jgi:rhodanese-related sulfurtransferase
MNRIILIFALMISHFSLKAQEVGSKAYGLLLQGLLSHTVPAVGVSEAAASGAVFIDSREAAEYKVSHLPGALWVGYEQADFSALKGLDKDTPLIVYCSVGYRSEKIAEKLQKMGFTDVHNLYGGIFEWVNRQQAVVDQQEQPTDSVHAYNRIWGVWLHQGVKVYD